MLKPELDLMIRDFRTITQTLNSSGYALFVAI